MSPYLSVAFLALAVDPAPLPTVDDLVAKLHAPRQGITRYELVIDAQKAVGSARPHRQRIWRDGDRYRVDHVGDITDKGSARRIDCTNCPNVGTFFAVHYENPFDLSKAATLGSLANRRQLAGDTRLRLDDLGATNEEVVNLANRGLDWYLGQDAWTDKRVERANWKGMSAYRIILSAPNFPTKPTFEVTLVPDRDFAAVAARSTWSAQDVAVVQTTESELARVHGLWLPTVCEYTSRKNGTVAEGLTQKIEYVSVNKPIDPKAFSLQGMDLVPGTLVLTEQGTQNWDGQQLGPATQLRFLPPADEQKDVRQSRSRKILLFALAGGAILISIFFVTRLIASLRTGKRPAGGADPAGIAGAPAAAGTSEDRRHEPDRG